MGTETKRRKKCFTGALGKSRKSGDCKCMWHKEWELEYLEVTTAKIRYSTYRNDGSDYISFVIVTNAQTCFSSAVKGSLDC